MEMDPDDTGTRIGTSSRVTMFEETDAENGDCVTMVTGLKMECVTETNETEPIIIDVKEEVQDEAEVEDCGVMISLTAEDYSQHGQVKSESLPRDNEDDFQIKAAKKGKQITIRKFAIKNSTKPKYQCSVCGKLFKAAAYLAHHIILKHVHTRCKCNVCGKWYLNAAFLAKHKVSHSQPTENHCVGSQGNDDPDNNDANEMDTDEADHDMDYDFSKEPTQSCVSPSRTAVEVSAELVSVANAIRRSTRFRERHYVHEDDLDDEVDVKTEDYRNKNGDYKKEGGDYSEEDRDNHKEDYSRHSRLGDNVDSESTVEGDHEPDPMDNELGDGTFFCKLCHHRSDDAELLKQHIGSHTVNDLKTHYSCKLCGEEVKLYKSSIAQQKKHKHTIVYHCVICDKGFLQLTRLINHLKNPHGGRIVRRLPVSLFDTTQASEPLIEQLLGKLHKRFADLVYLRLMGGACTEKDTSSNHSSFPYLLVHNDKLFSCALCKFTGTRNKVKLHIKRKHDHALVKLRPIPEEDTDSYVQTLPDNNTETDVSESQDRLEETVETISRTKLDATVTQVNTEDNSESTPNAGQDSCPRRRDAGNDTIKPNRQDTENDLVEPRTTQTQEKAMETDDSSIQTESENKTGNDSDGLEEQSPVSGPTSEAGQSSSEEDGETGDANEGPEGVITNTAIQETSNNAITKNQKNGRNRCKICDMKFENNRALAHHSRTNHDEQKTIRCSVCNKGFSDRGGLHRHVKLHTGDRRYSCESCDQKFFRQSDLDSHMILSHGADSFRCDICGQGLAALHTLNAHRKLHLDTRTWQCNLCKRVFQREKGLKRHMVSHSDSRPFTCFFCEKGFKEKRGLTQHLRIHTGERPYGCEVCQRRFTTKSHMNSHVCQGKRPDAENDLARPIPRTTRAKTSKTNSSIHTDCERNIHEIGYSGNGLEGRPPVSGSPPEGGQGSSKDENEPENNDDRQKVLSPVSTPAKEVGQNSSEDESEPGETNEGQKCVTTNNDAKNDDFPMTDPQWHDENNFKGEKTASGRYCCKVCKKEFKDIGELSHHTRTNHDELKSIRCPVCDKGFIHSASFTRHMRLHTGDRRFSCQSCDQKFFRQVDVERHMVLSHGADGFPCDVCGKVLLTRDSLSAHRKLHFDTRRWQCKVCGRTLQQESHLKKHMLLHTDTYPFKCSFCEKCFKVKLYLERHLRTHTGEKPYFCKVCEKRFTTSSGMSQHKRTGCWLNLTE